MKTDNKELIIKSLGREYIAEDEWWYNEALKYADTKEICTDSRREFLVNNFEHYHIKTKPSKRRHSSSSVETLHSLTEEMNRSMLSHEDEEYLDSILGPDPYTPFY